MPSLSFKQELPTAEKTATETATAWISRGFESLCHELAGKADGDALDYDIVIVGSGYGGAIAASELAGCSVPDGAGNRRPLSVCVLERGREYLPGSFPSRFSELPGHVRISMPDTAKPNGPREGLFDVRAGTDVSAIVANGLGGGSLINAGVMVEPDHAKFDANWPKSIRTDTELSAIYELARCKVGAADDFGRNTIDRHRAGQPLKYQALRRLAADTPGAEFSSADITVSMSRASNQSGVMLEECKRCGDCATGCNHGAKNSLDTNLLVSAWRQGADIFTGATVLRIQKSRAQGAEAWSLEVVHTDEKLRKRQGAPLQLRARRVILAAGTFGSTEILMRSRSDDLQLSNMLGQRFSTNGDMIAAGYDHAQTVQAVADENSEYEQRNIGPTITGMIKGGSERDMLIQELAVPGPLRRIFEEMVTSSGAFDALSSACTQDRTVLAGTDPHAVDQAAIARTAAYAVMGDDSANGTLELVGDKKYKGDGAIRVHWPDVRNDKLFADQIDALKKLAEHSGLAGKILPNPLWRMLPREMEQILEVEKGPLLTVHPLGGCPMGDDSAAGVVDDCGRVYDCSRQAPFDGLVVLDGSITPAALGVNPALTIAALSLRAVSRLKAEWGVHPTELPVRSKNAADISSPPLVRPIFRSVQTPRQPIKTEVQILERMSGRVMMKTADGTLAPRIVELTLRFSPIKVASLMASGGGTLQLDTGESTDKPASRIRIFEPDKWEALVKGSAASKPAATLSWKDAGVPEKLSKAPVTEEMMDGEAEFIAPLSGTLAAFVREPSSYFSGTANAMWAWFCNRGLRDFYQWAADGMTARLRGEPQASAAKKGPTVLERLKSSWNLASHARLARRLEYRLEIGAVTGDAGKPSYAARLHQGAIISGTKRLVYARRANPWRQLTEMTLDHFPGMPDRTDAVLKLDTRFLARQQWPLLRIVKQQDQPTALTDLAALALFVLRMMVTIHTWSFRKPDTLPARKPQRLPGVIPGLPNPEVQEIDMDQLPNGVPVKVRITRYRNTDTSLPPIVMIHGYSTSGTTFAHHAIDPNLASYFWHKGRDVCILDLRTSSGMRTARHPWNFEDVAFADIPVAINYIYREVNQNPGAKVRKLDILAHCMGSAMFSMALLKEPEKHEKFYEERKQLPGRINKVVLSQVGPLVVFTPDNIFRSYLMRYIRQLLPRVNYQFRPDSESALADQLLDRLLATLPYPEEEFDLENPPVSKFFKRTPFTGIRHRMDALYGQDFRLANVAPKTLEYIDDLFGPLSLVTISQAIHFARFKTITNRNGINEYVSRENIAKRWSFPTLSIHGTENGLFDIATLDRMRQVFADAGKSIDTVAVPGYGHQDCLIGKNAERDVFDRINQFLVEAKKELQPPVTQAASLLVEAATTKSTPRIAQTQPTAFAVQVPWIGPIIAPSPAPSDLFKVSATVHPVLGKPIKIALVAVARHEERIQLAVAGSGEQHGPVELLHITAADARDEWRQTTIDPQRWQGISNELLMLFVYLQSPVLDGTDYDKGNHSYNWQGAPGNSHIKGLAARTPSDDPMQRILDAIEETKADAAARDQQERDAIIEAIRHFIATTSRAELEKGLIKLADAPSPETRQSPSPQNATIELTFAVASCQYPAGMVDGEIAYASWRRLERMLGVQGPKFLMLLGDQIYADATAGLFDPVIADDRFAGSYQALLHHPAVRSVLRRIPVYTMLDDHEIDDNWEPIEGDAGNHALMRQGRAAYLHFMRRNGAGPAKDCSGQRPRLWYAFAENGFPFFMLDTRTDRCPRTVTTMGRAKIICDDQRNELIDWLTAHRESDLPKFIASPSILLPRLRRAHQHGDPASVLRSDAWDGFPSSLHAVLAHIADHGIRNVVFLSGDEHLSCHARATLTAPDGRTVEIQSIHSSALYAPFPFANATPDDLAGEEVFRFTCDAGDPRIEQHYVCKVSTEYAPSGDGFAIVRARRSESGWDISCDWNRESAD